MSGDRGYYGLLLGILAVAFSWSAIAPHDRFTWALEIFPRTLANWME